MARRAKKTANIVCVGYYQNHYNWSPYLDFVKADGKREGLKLTWNEMRAECKRRGVKSPRSTQDLPHIPEE